ncbi:MAG: hypothetical protein IKZ82_06245 [Clostridia bacterium]|nr:hypothetical protein [Clostridia bacterium]
MERPITSYLSTQRDSAVTREMLCAWTGLPDRRVRKEIELARRDGVPIVNFGRGYYISTDLDELDRYERMERSRAISRLSSLKPVRDVLKEAGRR